MMRFTYHTKYQKFLSMRLNYLTEEESRMGITKERFRPILITKGRKTGKEHAVMLRAVKYNDKIYFSRHKPDGDWFQNAMVNSLVKIKYNDSIFVGNAKVVTDEKLNEKISQLKYPGEERANEKRIAIEITLN
jgi:hypothetical protein